jgi:6-phosphogluconolactonase/glucosamine-6-phosphate isomerase/deaminase
MDIQVSEHAPQLAARRIAHRLCDAVRRRGGASLALSGGSTAPPMIAELAGSDVPWHAVGIWQVDERVAPDGHDARNAGQLEAFGALPCRVRPMPVTERDLRGGARRYAEHLPDRFDVVHLGIGDDGHTASWPPDRPDVRSSSGAVELVELFGGWPRMTVTGVSSTVPVPASCSLWGPTSGRWSSVGCCSTPRSRSPPFGAVARGCSSTARAAPARGAPLASTG